jgi:hypothetical protein
MTNYKLRNIGLTIIIVGIVVFIISGIIDVNESEADERLADTDNQSEANNEASKIEDERIFAGWLMGLSQLLVFSGIGFILFDIAERHGIKETEKTRETQKKDSAELKAAIMVCPRCERQTKYPISMIGRTVECPYCKLKVEIDGIQEEPEKDEGDPNQEKVNSNP